MSAGKAEPKPMPAGDPVEPILKGSAISDKPERNVRISNQVPPELKNLYQRISNDLKPEVIDKPAVKKYI
jgi:hypothetical protein